MHAIAQAAGLAVEVGGVVQHTPPVLVLLVGSEPSPEGWAHMSLLPGMRSPRGQCLDPDRRGRVGLDP